VTGRRGAVVTDRLIATGTTTHAATLATDSAPDRQVRQRQRQQQQQQLLLLQLLAFRPRRHHDAIVFIIFAQNTFI